MEIVQLPHYNVIVINGGIVQHSLQIVILIAMGIVQFLVDMLPPTSQTDVPLL